MNNWERCEMIRITQDRSEQDIRQKYFVRYNLYVPSILGHKVRFSISTFKIWKWTLELPFSTLVHGFLVYISEHELSNRRRGLQNIRQTKIWI